MINTEITYPNALLTGTSSSICPLSAVTSQAEPNHPAYYLQQHFDPGEKHPPTVQQFDKITQHHHMLLADHAYSPSHHNHVQPLF